jgi:hypothetical protein
MIKDIIKGRKFNIIKTKAHRTQKEMVGADDQ